MSFAVLPNPVPDRQRCSALCRMASLGPLLQTEIVAGFPEKVSDWTVMHLYPRHIVPGDSVIQSIYFRESLLQKNGNIFQSVAAVLSITLTGRSVKTEFVIVAKIAAIVAVVSGNSCSVGLIMVKS